MAKLDESHGLNTSIKQFDKTELKLKRTESEA